MSNTNADTELALDVLLDTVTELLNGMADLHTGVPPEVYDEYTRLGLVLAEFLDLRDQ